MKNIYSIRQGRNMIIAITILVGAFLAFALRGMIPAILGASVLYVLFRPFNRYLTLKRQWPRWLATWIIMILSFLIIVLPFLTLGLMIGNKVTTLLDQKEAIDAITLQVKNFIGLNPAYSQVLDKAVVFIQENVLGGIGGLLSGVGDMLLTLSMMYFMLYFMFYSSQALERGVMKYLPFNDKQTSLFAAEMRSSTYANVLGQGLIAFVQGALVALGFYMFNYSDPIFWGTIAFFVSFLPVVGAPLVFVPAAIIAFSIGDTRDAISLLLWGFILVTNIDNVLRYFISKYAAETHPLITIVGVVIGIPLFGILGLVFGPLLISWFLLLIKIVEEINKQSEETNVSG